MPNIYNTPENLVCSMFWLDVSFGNRYWLTVNPMRIGRVEERKREVRISIDHQRRPSGHFRRQSPRSDRDGHGLPSRGNHMPESETKLCRPLLETTDFLYCRLLRWTMW